MLTCPECLERLQAELEFRMDYRSIMAGGIPRQFNWSVFTTGLGVGSLSYVGAARGRARQQEAVAVEAG